MRIHTVLSNNNNSNETINFAHNERLYQCHQGLAMAHGGIYAASAVHSLGLLHSNPFQCIPSNLWVSW